MPVMPGAFLLTLAGQGSMLRCCPAGLLQGRCPLVKCSFWRCSSPGSKKARSVSGCQVRRRAIKSPGRAQTEERMCPLAVESTVLCGGLPRNNFITLFRPTCRHWSESARRNPCTSSSLWSRGRGHCCVLPWWEANEAQSKCSFSNLSRHDYRSTLLANRFRRTESVTRRD
jgi:hypothetical protein